MYGTSLLWVDLFCYVVLVSSAWKNVAMTMTSLAVFVFFIYIKTLFNFLYLEIMSNQVEIISNYVQ